MKNERILVIGALGQIGRELTMALKKLHGVENVIATDRVDSQADEDTGFRVLDVLDKAAFSALVKSEGITQIYMLAAILSATGEKNPQLAWNVNMQGLLNTLDIAVEQKVEKVFWPSSIGVFGPLSPKINCPQFTVTEPETVYGISKCAGEYWCNYYHKKYGLDVRSVRYPGLISYKAKPGGGTTDYAIDIFHAAIKEAFYNCYLEADATLPMMYMPDAINATLKLMQVTKEKITIRTAYNLSGMSFSPAQIAKAIQQHIPEFKICYTPDFRQEIAGAWPQSIDDSYAKADWGWSPEYNLQTMVKDMLHNLHNISETEVQKN
ncbi:NAD-dependent epimerase/dehydratase family protein [Pedobacter arcticus]|uniref:NAD-dependent epimerase/dehydratase family protein n=1 Tax=Pedobacter arcticus TaxID=752140 RepID=UPI0002F13FA4|nr:NAD-dependent epimerase/dehydratase family protein [Pedobacter arcticus]